MSNNMFLDKYLNRIGIKEELYPDLESLKNIQKQHLINIPFENIDIFLNKKLELNIDSLFDKIVEKRRGGICYELNGLFLILLKEIGYNVKYISARIRDEGTDLDHILLMVTIKDENYIVDVGFKDNYLYPIKIIPDVIQKNYKNDYKIKILNNNKYQLIKIIDDIESIVYTFTTDENVLYDFITRCEYFETTQNTYFTKNPFSAIETENGKIFITNEKLTIVKNNKIEIKQIKSKKQFSLYLKQFFNINLSTNF